jgi:tRNA-intron endonuclease
MLIWKSVGFLFIMEETPLIRGEIIADQTWISDREMIHELEQKGYGEIEKEKLFLKQFETILTLL